MGPDYRQPTPNLPSHWQAEQLAPADSPPSIVAHSRQWWRLFGDAELDRLVALALVGNLDLKMALSRLEQSRAERNAAGAELFPTVAARTGGQRNDNPFPGFAPGIRFNLFEVGFDALWEVDVFGRQRRRLEAASATTNMAAEEQAQVAVMVTAELARCYVEYRSLQNQLRITRSTLDARRQTLKLTQRLSDEGVGTRHDVVRAEAQVESTEAQLPRLQAGLFATLRLMETLLGRQPGALAAELEAPAAVPVAAGGNILASPLDVVRNRPDLRIAEDRLAAATAMQGVAIAEMFPKISLSAFLGLRNTDLESLFKSVAFSYGTAANLLQPLLNFGRIQAGIDLAEARQQEAWLAYEKAVLEALRETETALGRYLQEEAARLALVREVADQQESLRLSKLRYQEGVASFLEVLDAQRALYISEIELARCEAQTATHLIALYKALGGSGPADPALTTGRS